MNDFLTSVFPRAYAKIYNGMIQINGASFVSKYASNGQRSSMAVFQRFHVQLPVHATALKRAK